MKRKRKINCEKEGLKNGWKGKKIRKKRGEKSEKKRGKAEEEEE